MTDNSPTKVQKKTQLQLKFDWILIIILLFALFLYGWGTWNAGNANSFYTAAIESMTQSFKNFWYASFDPAGFITVDKPPVALWFMAISAKIFGLHGWSIVLPSVLFGVGSVYLMYRLIKPYFGRFAGNMAALGMAITPIMVADSRTNNMDTTLVFFLLLAFYFLEKAIDKHNTWWLIGSFALVGIAFNVKMLQAFMVLPAMYIFYWIASDDKWKKKTLKLIYGTLALIGFTLAWPLSVDLTSASNRPYEGGSENNSVLELAFGYNGTQRLLGQSTGTGGAFPGMGNNQKNNGDGAPNQNNNSTNPPSGPPGGSTNSTNPGTPPSGTQNNKSNGPGGPTRIGGGGGGAFNIGTAGPFRLFQSELGPQISWLLPFAILGLIGGLTYYHDSKRKWYYLTHKQKQLILWTGWLIPIYGFFSVASFFHPYYTIMLAPAIATLFGIGIHALSRLHKNTGLNDWRFYLLPAAFVLTAGLQAWYVNDYYPLAAWLMMITAIIVSLALIFLHNKQAKNPLIIFGMLSIMIAPTWWSLTPTIAQQSAQIPIAGPDLLTNSGGAGLGSIGGDQINTKLLSYLEKNKGNAQYLFATADSSTAAPYIIKTKQAVMAMGGFNGTDPAITLKQFKKLVKSGKVKYYYDAGKSGGTSNTEIVNWIKKNATKVKTSLYTETQSNSTSTTNSAQPNNTNKNMTPPTGTQRGQQPPQTGGMMGGPNSTGTLYDLSSIYN